MADRRSNYLPGVSDQLYYEKQVQYRTIYAGLEEAKTVAQNMTDNWRNTFVKFYNFVHANPQFVDAVKSLGASAPKGVIIRVANYILANYLFTGKVQLNYAIMKATKYINNELVANYVAIITLCTAYKDNTIAGFIQKVNLPLSVELKTQCSRLAYDYYVDEPIIGDIASRLASYPMPVLPRSYLYYYVTGMATPKQTTEGSQGGEATEPATPTVIPVSPTNAVKSLSEIIASFRRG